MSTPTSLPAPSRPVAGDPVRHTSIGSGWRFIDADPQPMDGSRPAFPAFNESWWNVDFPGDLNAALVRAGRIPDPHYADNGQQAYWITRREWWARKVFDADLSSPAIDLVFDGLDGLVEVFLNGEKLGYADNAFYPHRYEVASRLRTTGNELLLRFYSLETYFGRPRGAHRWGGWHERTWVRKPGYNFGWDWALPIPGIGILDDVRLEHHEGPRILDVGLRPWISGRVDFDFAFNKAAREAGCVWRVRLTGHGADLSRTLLPWGFKSYLSLEIPLPRLWWPRGYGEQPLYDWTAELVLGDRVIEFRSGRIGLREIEIMENPFTPDAGDGRSFWLKINGEPIFIKGANWIPTELWPAETRQEDYDWYLQKLADTHANMIRVWGGGIYERTRFYELCDRLGLMVWQDFMFASSAHPFDRLVDSIFREANYQLRRLRNHSSIVLWCGINEDIYSWYSPGDPSLIDRVADTAFEEGQRLDRRWRDDPLLYTGILRGLASRWAMGVPYVESSPMGHDDIGNDLRSGNHHQSCLKHMVYHVPDEPRRFREHFDRTASFGSEFCIHGPANESTLRRFLTDKHVWPPDDVWTYHIQKGHKNLPYHEQMAMFAAPNFGPITDLSSHVKVGQALHVEMMRAEFETARRDRPNNGGTMVWMYNDCWPTSNWSIIDYYRQPKPAYYAAKRACAPVLPIVFERRGVFEWFLSNDRPVAVEGRFEFGCMRLDGSVLFRRETLLRVEKMTTARVWSAERASLPLAPHVFLYARWNDEPAVTYFADGWAEVPWPKADYDAALDASVGADGGGYVTRLTVKARGYLRLFQIRAATDVPEFWAEDNAFDLVPGDTRRLDLRSARPLSRSDLVLVNWRE